MITYHYVFKNPIGSSWDFATDWNTTLGTSYKYDYVSAIPMKEDQGLDPAEILHFKDGVWLFEDDTPVPPANYEAIPVALFACTPSATVRTIESGVSTPYAAIPARLVAFSMGSAWFTGSNVTYNLYTGPIAISTTLDDGLYYTGVIEQRGMDLVGHNYWGRFGAGNISITLDFPDADVVYYVIVRGTNNASNTLIQVVDAGDTTR